MFGTKCHRMLGAFLFRRKLYGIWKVIWVPNKTSWNLESYFSSEQSVIHLSESWRLGKKFRETHNEILGTAKKQYDDVC